MRIALTTIGLILGLMMATGAWAGHHEEAAEDAKTEKAPAAVDAGPSDTPVAAPAAADAEMAPEADDTKAADEATEE